MWEEYLNRVYHDPNHAASFTSPDKLYKTVKQEGRYNISQRKIKKWLQKEEPYTLHREVRRKTEYDRVIVGSIDQQWDVDSMYMESFSKKNKGYKYVLIAIDILSCHLWTRPLKTLQGKEMVEAFQSIFKEGRKPKTVRSDKGTEFVNQVLSSYFKKEKVHHFVTQNIPKANYAERVIKTLKSKIIRYFTDKQTHEWIDLLQDFTESYNNTYHRSIKRTPNQVNKNNEVEVWMDQYYGKPKIVKPKPKPKQEVIKYKFRVGDLVRISHLKHVFQRQYDQRWTGEIFKVIDRKVRTGTPVYTLKDYQDEGIIGSFYEDELQKVTDTGLYKIEKILKTRGRKGQKEHLVRWLHWPPKFDSWVKDKDVKNL